MSILEDYDHEYVEPINVMLCELYRLELLGSTSLDTVSVTQLEAMTPSSPELVVAMEGIGGIIREKIRALSEKIKGTFVKINTTIKTKLSEIVSAIVRLGKRATTETLNDASKTDHVSTAPAQGIVKSAIGAASETVGIIKQIPMILAGFKDKPAVVAGVAKMAGLIEAIKWPFGKITTAISNGGARLVVTIPAVTKEVKTASIRSLQWTASSVGTISSMAERMGNAAKSGGAAVLSATEPLVENAVTFAKGIKTAVVRNHIANKEVQTQYGGLVKTGLYVGGLTFSLASVCVVSIILTVFKLLKSIVMGALRLLSRAFHALSLSTPLE